MRRIISKRPLTTLDIKYHSDKFDELLMRSDKPTVANQPYLGIICSEKVFQRLIQHSETQNIDERKLREKALLKWIFEQGGTFSFEKIAENLGNYAIEVEMDETLQNEIAVYSRSVFTQQLGTSVTRDTFIITDSRELYNTYSPTHQSSPGFTACGDRREKATRIKGIKEAKESPYDFDPIIAGMRLKDNKYRNIFIDSLSNYFRESRVFSRLFEIIESLPSNVASHHYDVAAEILMVKAKAAYGGDYQAMDQHFSLEDLISTLRMCQQIFGIEDSELNQMIHVLEKLLTVSLIVGQEVWDSVWNLLSGVYPTHDLETIRNLSIAIATCCKLGINPILVPRKLKAREAYIKVCGDDMIILFGPDHPSKDEVVNMHAHFAAACGQILECEKADWVENIDTEGIFFCKRFYALSFSIKGYIMSNSMPRFVYPKYSIEKALNGIYHPEHIPQFSDKRSLIYWVQSVMDNAAGHSAYTRILYELFDSNSFFKDPTLLDFNLSPDDMAVIMKKWNNRQYGLVNKTDSPFWVIYTKWCKTHLI